jgi:small subunit ribosomal protein S9
MATTDTTKQYIEAVGRRKTATARIRATESTRNALLVNDKDLSTYFPTKALQLTASDALAKAKTTAKFKITAHVEGGGVSAQAEAIRHATARMLIVYDAELRKKLKKAGFLKRDPRSKERRKFGLKKARKAAQWSKR